MRFSGTLAAAAVAVFFATSAQAVVIDFDMPTAFADPYTQDGYTVTNTGGDSLGNWIAVGLPQYNANGSNPTIFVNYGSTTTTFTKADGGVFDFYSIDLADVYNNGAGGDVSFTFNYAAGGSASQIVTIDNLPGLQTFVFGQVGLTSVQFTALTTQGPWLQFDLVSLGAAVPEPATWTMMIGGFAVAGVAMRRRKAAISLA